MSQPNSSAYQIENFGCLVKTDTILKWNTPLLRCLATKSERGSKKTVKSKR